MISEIFYQISNSFSVMNFCHLYTLGFLRFHCILLEDGAVLNLAVFTEITTRRNMAQMRTTFEEYKKVNI